MKIKLSKTLLECALIFQAKNDIRYYLNGICFKADGRVASTDGHRAFIGGKHDGLMESDLILSITKSPTKKYDYAVIDTDAEIITYHHDTTLKVGIGMVSVVDGKFPDIDRIIPKDKQATETIGFRAKYLADLDKAADLFNPRWNSVTFDLNGSSGCAVARFKSPSSDEGIIIVMPMRID